MTRPKARRRRAGSVVETKEGSFQGRVTITRPDGKRTTLSKTFRDRRHAERWVAETELKKQDGETLGVKWSQQPLMDWLREFYTKHRLGPKGRLLSLRTCQDDLALIELYIARRNPTLAGTPLAKVSTTQLASHFRELAEHGREDGQPLAIGTVSRVYRILRARLGFAVRLGRLKVSPVRADLIPVDGRPKDDQRTLTEDQVFALLAVAPRDKYGSLFATLLWTGARPSEMAGLTWRDVDLERGVVSIRRSLVRTRPTDAQRSHGTAWTLAPTKTRKDRTVPIPDELVDLLRGHKAKQAAHRLLAGPEFEDHGLVFPTDFGRPVHLDTIGPRHFKPLLPVAAAHMLVRALPTLPAPSRSSAYAEAKQARDVAEASAMRDADFPDLSLYGLRHSMATLLLKKGIHAKIVADRLGHANTATTLQVYSHVTPDIQAQAVTALEELFGAKRRVG